MLVHAGQYNRLPGLRRRMAPSHLELSVDFSGVSREDFVSGEFCGDGAQGATIPFSERTDRLVPAARGASGLVVAEAASRESDPYRRMFGSVEPSGVGRDMWPALPIATRVCTGGAFSSTCASASSSPAAHCVDAPRPGSRGLVRSALPDLRRL